MLNFGISLGWRVVVLCTEIQSTHPNVWIHGMERFRSSLGTPMGTDTVTCDVTAQINVQSPFAPRHCFKYLHNMLSGYHDIYITKTNREQLKIATTEVEMREKGGRGFTKNRSVGR